MLGYEVKGGKLHREVLPNEMWGFEQITDGYSSRSDSTGAPERPATEQEALATKLAIKELFPQIPHKDLEDIWRQAFKAVSPLTTHHRHADIVRVLGLSEMQNTSPCLAESSSRLSPMPVISTQTTTSCCGSSTGPKLVPRCKHLVWQSLSNGEASMTMIEPSKTFSARSLSSKTTTRNSHGPATRPVDADANPPLALQMTSTLAWRSLPDRRPQRTWPQVPNPKKRFLGVMQGDWVSTYPSLIRVVSRLFAMTSDACCTRAGRKLAISKDTQDLHTLNNWITGTMGSRSSTCLSTTLDGRQ